jgi:hypothetical protein
MHEDPSPSDGHVLTARHHVSLLEPHRARNARRRGLDGFGQDTADYWRDFITQTGFRIKREESLEELMHFIRADKPLPYEGQQLIFDF